MIEVVPDSITDVSAERTPGPPIENLGAAMFDGEIVDSKCYLGVMKPGQGPTHRDCAVRCLLGQVPAMLVVRESKGVRRIALIVSDGESRERTLPALAGKPVRVRGALLVRGGQSFLSVSPTDIIPLPQVTGPPSAMPDHRHQHDRQSDFD